MIAHPERREARRCRQANEPPVYTVDPDGAAPVNLTNDPVWDGYPAWSPDGRQIAFSNNNGVEFDLYVMDADGSAMRRLAGVAGANGIANDCCPAWRP